MVRFKNLRDSSFSESWWKLEKILRDRKKNREYVKIPHEGPNGETVEKFRSNGKGEETSLTDLEEATEEFVTSEEPPC